MPNRMISDKATDNMLINHTVMDNLEILGKLSLSDEERTKAMEELKKVLTYMDKLNELDTEGIEPLIHINKETNVFREDEVTSADGTEDALKNAPASRDDKFVVPKTL